MVDYAQRGWGYRRLRNSYKGYENPELEDFRYRKFIQITGSSGGAQTDYQVMLKVYPGFGQDTGSTIYLMGTARPDLADLRFVDENNKEIPYWIEANLDDVAATITANGYVYVWVKVPLILSTQVTIKMLWGHPTALAKSNGTLTFPVFDHFAGAALNTVVWNGSGGGSSSVSGSKISLVSYILRSKTSVSRGACVRSYCKFYGKTSNDGSFFGFEDYANLGIYTDFLDYNTANVIRSQDSGYSEVSTNIAEGNWGLYEFRWYDGYVSATLNGSAMTGSPLSVTEANLPNGPCILRYGGGSASYKLELDWILDRKYTPIEPVAALTWVG